jgi:hypothetical protein
MLGSIRQKYAHILAQKNIPGRSEAVFGTF